MSARAFSWCPNKARLGGVLLSLTMLTGLGLASGVQTSPATAAVSAPAKPVLASRTVSNATISFSWTEPTADGSVVDYEYAVRPSGTTQWGASVSAAGASSAVASGLTNGAAYNVRVRALSAGAASAWGAAFTATPRPYPGAPGAISAQAQGTTATIRWTYPRDDGEPVTGYAAHLRDSAGSYGTPIDLGDGGATSYTFTGLVPGTTYYVQLHSANRFGVGSWSPETRVVVPVPATPAPESLVATAHAGGVGLAWSTTAGPGTLFEVRHRVAVTGASWVADPSTSQTSADVVGLQDGTTYLLQVRAVASSAASAWVQARKAAGVRPATMAAPTVSLLPDKTSSRVSWAPSSAAALVGYDVTWFSPGAAATTVRVPASETSHVITGLPTGTQNRVQTRAVNVVGAGNYSQTAAAFVPHLTMPTLTINTTDSAPILDKENYVTGSYALDPNGSSVSALSGPLSVKGHGNSTWPLPKKPYRLKLDSKAALMGMPSNKNWVLLANYKDRTMLRNAVALHLGQQTGLAWTPRTAFVEVIVNGRYEGLYQLAEHVRIDSSRVNITSMSPSDTSGDAVSGGYLVERDSRLDLTAESGFRTQRKTPFTLHDPDPPTSEQLGYISSYVESTENAILAAPFDDPTQGYRNFVDTSSFVDWYLVEEYVRNTDMWNSSTYMYKPRGGKLFMGPLWDFDLSQGRVASSVPTGWFARTASPWFARLLQDPDFEAAFDARWRELAPAVHALPAFVASTATDIASAEQMDQARWGYLNDYTSDVGDLKQWLTARADWIDTQVPPAPTTP